MGLAVGGKISCRVRVEAECPVPGVRYTINSLVYMLESLYSKNKTKQNQLPIAVYKNEPGIMIL